LTQTRLIIKLRSCRRQDIFTASELRVAPAP
jgi:hypothetical protein